MILSLQLQITTERSSKFQKGTKANLFMSELFRFLNISLTILSQIITLVGCRLRIGYFGTS